MIKDIFTISKQYNSIVKEFNLLNVSESNIKYGIEFEDKLLVPKEEYLISFSGKKNLDFALDDLKKIIEHIKFKSNLNFIPKSSKFHYDNIKIMKGYINPKQIYILYLNIILNKFVLDTQEKQILTFQIYFDKFTKYIKQNIDLITFVKFIKSNNISFYSSGLAYQIFNEKDITYDKALSYLEDSYFNVFQDICSMNNFIIDRRYPWIIIRKVNDDIVEVNKEKYENVYETEIDIIYEMFKVLYNVYVQNILNEKDRENCNIINFNLNYNHLINFYIFMKLKENLSYVDENIFKKYKNFFLINSNKNGISDTIKKISEISLTNDSIYENFQSLYL